MVFQIEGGIILVIKNAFYKIKNEVYFINRVQVDPDREYRLYCQKAYPVKNLSDSLIIVITRTRISLQTKKTNFFYDFFDHAVFLNEACLSCEYYDDINISVLLYPLSGAEDENIRYALCSLNEEK